MNSTLNISALGLALTLGVAPAAHAQMKWTDKGFVNVNFGVQAPSHSLAAETTPDIYGEPASIRSSQDVGGGAFFDIAGGYKIWSNLVVGIGFTHVGSTADMNVNAQIPDPVAFDSPRSVTTTIPDAKHSQNAIHLTGTWMIPVTDKVDVGVQFGPTIWLVSQDIPGIPTIQEPGPTITSFPFEKQDKTTVGIHLGADVAYMFTPRYGAGVLMRYTWGSADLAGTSDSVTVGGLQIGGGLRVRF